MKKYFNRKESDLIITLLKSNELDSVRLGFTLIETHPRYKNFVKLITYRNKITSSKDNLKRELQLLTNYLNNCEFNSIYFQMQARFLIRFIKKRTKHG